MVMNQFVTTYRKDYLWPYVRAFGSPPDSGTSPQQQYRDNKECECHKIQDPGPTVSHGAVLGPNALKEEAWTRLGPMGPLLDPKLYPARVSSAPETSGSRFNQPNVFLQRLKEKYPFIYECLRSAPPDDLLARINRDRLRTTYMVDFSKMNEFPNAPYDELIRAAGVTGLPPCPEPVRLPGDPCRPNQKTKAFRPAIISNSTSRCKSDKGGREADPCRHDIMSWNPFLAGCEKQENVDPLIQRWGQMIYRDTSHAHGNLCEGRKLFPRPIIFPPP